MRQETTVEGAFFIKSQNYRDGKNRKKQNSKFGGSAFNTKNNKTSNIRSFPSCLTAKKTIILKINAGGVLMHVVLSVVS